MVSEFVTFKLNSRPTDGRVAFQSNGEAINMSRCKTGCEAKEGWASRRNMICGMEHFSRRRWTTIPAISVSCSVHEGNNICFSCECTISLVYPIWVLHGCSSPATKVLHVCGHQPPAANLIMKCQSRVIIVVPNLTGKEWSSGCERWWVQIPAPDTGWTFSHHIVVKIILFVWKILKKIKKKKPVMAHFISEVKHCYWMFQVLWWVSTNQSALWSCLNTP